MQLSLAGFFWRSRVFAGLGVALCYSRVLSWPSGPIPSKFVLHNKKSGANRPLFAHFTEPHKLPEISTLVWLLSSFINPLMPWASGLPPSMFMWFLYPFFSSVTVTFIFFKCCLVFHGFAWCSGLLLRFICSTHFVRHSWAIASL